VDGPLGFFVFELQAHGLKDELEQAAVLVTPDGQVVEGGADLLSRLDEARSVDTVPFSAAEVDRMHRAALDWITAEVAARERALQARNDETVSAQVESLRLTTERRRLWLREQIQEGRSEPIVRMRRAQLSRLESDYETRRAALEAKRGISVGNRLVAAGMVV
jgi:hypothetical protein